MFLYPAIDPATGQKVCDVQERDKVIISYNKPCLMTENM